MPTVDDHGFPVYSDTDAMPDWDGYANTLGAALGEALDQAAQDEKDNDSVPTVAELPTEDNWVGRLILVEENTTLYVCTDLPASWGVVGGPTLPSFRVVGSSSHTTGSVITTITEWDTPEKNVGFGGWSSGVLTIDKAGDYIVTASLRGSVAEVQVIIRKNSDDEVFGAAGGFDSLATTMIQCAVNDTLEVRAYSNSSTGTWPERTIFAVRYLGT